MRYTVVWPDGQRFGPVDIDTLRVWVQENRVGPNTVILDSMTNTTLTASQLPDLQSLFVTAQTTTSQIPYHPGLQAPMNLNIGSPYQPYYHAPPAPKTGGKETTWSAVCLAISFACCSYLSLVGIIFAIFGMIRGQRGALILLVLHIIILALGIGIHALTLFSFPFYS